VTVSIEGAVGDTVSELEDKVHEMPVGAAQVRLTAPLKLSVGAMLRVAWVEVPEVMLAVEVEALKPKVAGAVEVVELEMAAKRP
jgi:hypothetical protein